MKRPGVVWIFTIWMILGIIIDVTWLSLYSIGKITNADTIYAVTKLVFLIPSLIMTYKFFQLSKSAKLWVHITYGASVVLSAFSLISAFSIQTILIIAVTAFFWWAIINYIDKKQVNGQLLFT